jgi:hypothetical protein
VSANGLQIEFQRSGGFAGLTMAATVDTAELPPAEARELEHLVESLEASGAGEAPAAGKPDRFQYDLTIRRGGKSRSFRLAEQELTPDARELVKRLTERARQSR